MVLKYCEILDEFVRVRATSEEAVATRLGSSPPRSRHAYHEFVVELCVVDYHEHVVPLLETHVQVYKPESLVELLYQICIEVNPHLEIHSVTIPAGEPEDGQAPGDGDAPGAEEGAALGHLRQVARDIEPRLSRRIVGQPEAVSALSQSVRKASIGLKDPRKPVGVFLLVGPTGTGKTELAKALSRELFGGTHALVRIDCSEYALPHEYAKLIGAPPGYVGHNEGGHLTEAVKEHKSCVVLFDEIEKAHDKVHNLLLQIMDEGRLTDSKGELVSFQDCIVLMTSNVGVDQARRITDRMGFDAARREVLSEDLLDDALTDAVREAFRPEFVNRIDRVIRFRALTREDCERIVRLQIEEMASYLEQAGVKLQCSRAVERRLAELGWSAEFGARELRRHIRDAIEHPLTERLMAGDFEGADVIRVSVRGRTRIVLTGATRRGGAKTQPNPASTES